MNNFCATLRIAVSIGSVASAFNLHHDRFCGRGLRLNAEVDQFLVGIQQERNNELFWRRATETHRQECERGFALFAPKEQEEVMPDVSWQDDDFVSWTVDQPGPDTGRLTNPNRVFQTKEPVFTPQECNDLIREARETITNGLLKGEEEEEEESQPGNQQQRQPTNSQLGEAKVSDMPKGLEWLREKLQSKLFPLLVNRFGGAGMGGPAELTLNDALVIGYGYFGGGSRSQPLHRDASLLSLNVALSPPTDYIGGGTYFQDLDTRLGLEQGHVMCHAGGSMHAGNGIESGERWILVLFVLAQPEPQPARRCHTMGLQATRAGNHQEALQAFAAGLAVAPQDHLLQLDLGRVHAQMGHNDLAQECLARAHANYPQDCRAAMGLAKSLLNNNKPREAMQWFESVLEVVGMSDQRPDAWMPRRSMAWEARVGAAHCALLVCDNNNDDDDDECESRKDVLARMPQVLEWIMVAQRAAPTHKPLEAMKQRANQLLLLQTSAAAAL